MPSPASPAMVSPATTPMVSGRNSGTETSIAVTATNSPFWLIRSRKAGPLPGGTAEETRTTTAITTGIAASARSIACVLRRRNSCFSSEASSEPLDGRRLVPATWLFCTISRCTVGSCTGGPSLCDIEALPRQSHEAVLQAATLHREPADTHPVRH
ncbi:hypothetical protein QF036_000790 [Arthrobacter globiformis]|nr:hypothetical protein [Arthrobacter globiformis]